jgi:hypothetical protein
MGHYINGFVARCEPLTFGSRALPGARVCQLKLGFGFLPLTATLASRDDPAAQYAFLDRLTSPMAAWAVEQSREFAVAYIQTDYFGGTGSQCAIVWRDGAVGFGPLATGDEYGSVSQLLDGAINRAFRELGVERGDALDEFEALGLHWHRHNDGWAEAAGGHDS